MMVKDRLYQKSFSKNIGKNVPYLFLGKPIMYEQPAKQIKTISYGAFFLHIAYC